MVKDRRGVVNTPTYTTYTEYPTAGLSQSPSVLSLRWLGALSSQKQSNHFARRLPQSGEKTRLSPENGGNVAMTFNLEIRL